MTFPSLSPLEPLQEAVYDVLRLDEELMELITVVGDDIAEGQAMPYTRIGEFLSTADNAHDSFGREVTTTLHTWTDQHSNKPGQRITARIDELLDHRKLAINGHKNVSIRAEFDQILRDPNPAIRHHVQRFRIVTQQTEAEGS